MDNESPAKRRGPMMLIVGLVVLVSLCGVAAVLLLDRPGMESPKMQDGAQNAANAPPQAAEPAATPPKSADERKELAYSMMCLGKYGSAAKAVDAPRADKVALCDCIVSQTGLTATSPNYEAEMTRCFAKMLNQPYQQTAPADGAAAPASPPVSAAAPGTASDAVAGHAAPSIDLPDVSGAESAPAPLAPLAASAPAPRVSPYATDLASIPAPKYTDLENACVLTARAKAQELKSDEELFLSMNRNYIDFCMVSRARSEGLLPPDEAMKQKAKEN